MNSLLESLGINLGDDSALKNKPVAKSKSKNIANNNNIVDAANLFSDEFTVKLKQNNVDSLIKKINTTKSISSTDPTKALNSKKVTLKEKLEIIRENVLRVLGHQRKNTIVIKDKDTFYNYVSEAISSGRISIDTETNNSTDPVTCDIMGLCLYYPGGKQAYIPINHVNPDTGIRLDWQLTELDCKEQLQRILDAKIFKVMHNGKFDYEVIDSTCDIKVSPDWDTIIAARLLNENEESGLKKQYIKYIDPGQEKYDIEHLFIVPYKYIDPEIFALYAATDSMMTDKLYLYQLPQMTDPSNEQLYWLFMNIEMPIVTVTAEMEMEGMSIDVDFGEKLKNKYYMQLADIDEKINLELENLKKPISIWRSGIQPTLDKDNNWIPKLANKNTNAPIISMNDTIYVKSNANDRMKNYEPKKSKKSKAEIEKAFPEVEAETGRRYKLGKAPSELLPEEINLASPAQLAVLFYDVLGCESPSKNSPRGTGEEELKTLASKYDNLTICHLILKRRGIVKLITTYIDVIPKLAQHWPDTRVRFKLNSMGTDTGRYSSGGKFKFLEGDDAVEISGINIQNIPSHNPEIRMLFQAKCELGSIQAEENEPFIIPEITEVETTNGWKYVNDLVEGDLLIIDNTPTIYRGRKYLEETREWAILAYND